MDRALVSGTKGRGFDSHVALQRNINRLAKITTPSLLTFYIYSPHTWNQSYFMTSPTIGKVVAATSSSSWLYLGRFAEISCQVTQIAKKKSIKNRIFKKQPRKRAPVRIILVRVDYIKIYSY